MDGGDQTGITQLLIAWSDGEREETQLSLPPFVRGERGPRRVICVTLGA